MSGIFRALITGVFVAAAALTGGATLAAALGLGALTAGLTIVSTLLAPDLNLDIGSARGDTRSLIRTEIQPARWVLGRCRVGGVLANWYEYGSRDEPFTTLSFRFDQFIGLATFDEDRPDSERARWWPDGRFMTVNEIGNAWCPAFGDRGTFGEVPRPSFEGDGVRVLVILAEGACEGIEAIWIGPEKIWESDTAVQVGVIRPTGKWAGKISVMSYCRGDGLIGNGGAGNASVQPLATLFQTDFNEANVRGYGLSYCVVNLWQPTYGNQVDNRFWSRFPDLNFLVKGAQITWPGQSTPIWTDNAAAIRYWWLTVRRGVPPAAIDATEFAAAFALCDERPTDLRLRTTTSAGAANYPDLDANPKRYTINGLVSSGDDVEAVERQMDMAWQGYSVEAGGVHYFRPGVDRAVRRHIGRDDILVVGPTQPAPAMQERVNAVSTTLAQSAAHDYLELEIPELVDQELRERDGRYLPHNIRNLAFVQDPRIAIAIQAIFLRRARVFTNYGLRLGTGSDQGVSNLELLPTDVVTIDLPELNVFRRRCMITKVNINPDWSVDLELQEAPAGIYSGQVVGFAQYPELAPDFTVFDPREVPAPRNVAATVVEAADAIGPRLTVSVTWTAVNVLSTQVRCRTVGATDWEVVQVAEPPALCPYPPVAPGTVPPLVEVQARHVMRDGFRSAWAPTPAARTVQVGDQALTMTSSATTWPGGFTLVWTATGTAAGEARIGRWTITLTPVDAMDMPVAGGTVQTYSAAGDQRQWVSPVHGASFRWSVVVTPVARFGVLTGSATVIVSGTV